MAAKQHSTLASVGEATGEAALWHTDFPAAYAMLVAGDCMSPWIEDGQHVEVHRDAPIKAGDVVVIHPKPGIRLAGQYAGAIKRLIMGTAPHITFPTPRMVGNALPVILVKGDNRASVFPIAVTDILAMHLAVGPIDADRL